MEADIAVLLVVQASLSQPQIERFERVNLRRQRQRCQPDLVRITPGYIDLVELTTKHVRDPDVLVDLDTTLLAYERLITPLYVQLDALEQGSELEDARALVATSYAADGQTILPGNSPERHARLAEYIKQRTQRNERTIPPQQRLAAITRESFAAIEAIIPPGQRDSLRAEYLFKAYPYIHPDRCDPTSLLTRMLAAEGLPADLRQAMQARIDQWRAAYERLTREMEQHYEEYSEIFARTLASEKEHTAAIRRLRLERLTASEEAVKAVYAMLPPELQASFTKSCSYFEQGATQYRQEETNPRRGNP